MSDVVYDQAFCDRAMRDSLAKLLARLTYDNDSAGASLHNKRWSQRIKRTRNMQHIRFSTAGVHLANNVLCRWPSTLLDRLPRLSEVLTAVRDYATASLDASIVSDVSGATESISSRGLVPPSSLGDDGRVWWASCPADGSLHCTHGDEPASPFCDYCRGDGFITRGDAPSLAHLLALYSHGDSVARAENVAREFLASEGVRVDRVAWVVWTRSDYGAVYRRCRFGCRRDTPEGEIVAATARWATRGEWRDPRPMLRDLDEMNVHLLDALRGTVVLGVERL